MLRLLILAFAGYLLYLFLRRFFVKAMSSVANEAPQQQQFRSRQKPVDTAKETEFEELDSKIKSD
jgi:hypothetical protein